MYYALSDREQTVLEQARLGLTNKDIGRELGIAEATVKVHMKRIMRILEVTNRVQAINAGQPAWPEV